MGGVGRAVGGIFGGGGGGGTTYNVAQPPAPAPIDYDKMYAAATKSAIAQMNEQETALRRLYPDMIGQQMGTARQVSRELDNAYLAQTRAVIAQEMGAAATPSAIEAELQRRAQADLRAGPTAADRQIQAAGLGAMGVRADQVSGPSDIRQLNPALAQAAQMGQVGDVRAQQVAASRMGNFGAAQSRNIAAGQVGAGALGATLMSRAQQMAQSTGRLSAEAERDAVQSARQGMAARGMATGSAGVAAEMLNRDRFARQRQFEDLGFAQGVQGQDLTRQFQNVGNRLAADQSNQASSMQAELANLQARYNAAAQNGNWQQAAAIQNQAANLQASLANQQAQFGTNQFNAANQQQANLANQASTNQMGLANQQRDQVLGEMAMRAQMSNQAANQAQLAQNREFMLSANNAFNTAEDRRMNIAQGANQLDLARRARRVTLAEGYGGLDPYARGLDASFGLGQTTMGTGTNMIGSTFNNAVSTAGNVNSFNSNMQAGMFNTWQNNNAAIQAANITGRASQQAGQMAMLGGFAQGAGSFFSDERMKKDIKQTGKDGVLGLKTYEYRYKGEGKDVPKRTGFMAQDVQKVLPEAVEEVTYQGKKRLAIKPMVLGQTLAAALASQQDAMFSKGYTVGAGFKG